jgi:hypothetical protein
MNNTPRRAVAEIIDGGGPTVTARLRCPGCNEIVASHTYAADISVEEAVETGPGLGLAFLDAWLAHRCAP